MKAAFVARACCSRASQQPAAPRGDRSWRGCTANGLRAGAEGDGENLGNREGEVCNRRNKVHRGRKK